MMRSIRRAVTIGAAFLGSVCVAQAASAVTFSFTGSDASATAPSSLSYTDAGSGLSLNVYGTYVTQTKVGSLNQLQYAKAETYKGAGLGDLYGYDSTSNGTHQIDNAVSTGSSGVQNGVDMIVLQFSKAVTLSEIDRANYSSSYRSPGAGYDTDLSFMAYTDAGGLNSLVNGVDESQFASLLNSTSSTAGTKFASTSSNIWLVAAKFGETDDAFKLTKIVTTSGASAPPAAVPEAATWAMMIVGMGVVGSAMRRRKPEGFADTLA